jgi:hypothetical protein
MRIYERIISAAAVLILSSQGASLAQSPDTSFARAEPYIWRNAVIGGGGFVTGIITHPRQNGLMYARTDVGDAYRSEDSGRHWIPITDWLGMADINLTGIESLAVDTARAGPPARAAPAA